MLVFDASAAVKWFKLNEVGSDDALALLAQAAEVDIWLPDNCAHEVLQQVARLFGAEAVPEAWDRLRSAHVSVAHLDGRLIAEAALVSAEYGCAYYDALAPALARILGATLVSADRRAHRTFPGVMLLDEVGVDAGFATDTGRRVLEGTEW